MEDRLSPETHIQPYDLCLIRAQLHRHLGAKVWRKVCKVHLPTPTPWANHLKDDWTLVGEYDAAHYSRGFGYNQDTVLKESGAVLTI